MKIIDKKWKKFLLLAIAVMLSIPVFSIKASSSTRTLETRKQPYTFQLDDSYPYPFNLRTYQQDHYQFTMNEGGTSETTYCIDYSTMTAGGNTYSLNDTYNKLSDYQKTILNRALMFGYNESSGIQYGGTADENNIATQTMIWLITAGQFNGANEERLINAILRDSAKSKEIYYTMKKYILDFDIVPSFASSNAKAVTTYTMNYNLNTNKYELTLNDTNHVLRYFDFTSDKVTITKNENSITFSSDVPFEQATVQSTKQLPKDELPKLIGGSIDYWLGAGYQDQASLNINGSYERANAYFNLKTAPVGNMTIQKTGDQLIKFEKQEDDTYQPVYEKRKIADTSFEVYDSQNTLVDTVTTNPNGTIATRNLPLGDYYGIEVNTITGLVVDSTPIPFTLKEDGKTLVVNNAITVNDEREKANVSMNKTFEMDESQIQNPYDYTKFGVYNKKDISDKEGNVLLKANSLIEVFQIDKEGHGQIKTDLPLYNDYYIKELETAKGYVLDTQEYEFSLDNPQKLPTLEIKLNNDEPIHNRLLRGSLKVIKTEDNGNRLNDAIFGLFDSKGNLVKEFNISEDGEFTIDNLLYGSYKLKEIRSPEGYKVSDVLFEFDIKEDEQLVEVNYKNNKIEEKKETPKKDEVIPTGDSTSKILLELGMLGSAVILLAFTMYRKRNSNK